MLDDLKNRDERLIESAKVQKNKEKVVREGESLEDMVDRVLGA